MRKYRYGDWETDRPRSFEELKHSLEHLRASSRYLDQKFADEETTDYSRPDSEDEKCRRLFTRALAYTIKDARGACVSGWQTHNPQTRLDIQQHAREFFLIRSEEQCGWGWYIRLLNLDERQVKLIEQYALKPETEKIRSGISNKFECDKGRKTSWLQ